MKVLLLAPQPFYQDRGTPIAIELILRSLSKRGDDVDVLTYHEGETHDYHNVLVYRIPAVPFVKNIPPSFSWKKIACDIVMFFKAVSMAVKNRYDVVHAVEESVFIAMVLKWAFKVPYIYDMDSSMVEQMVDKFPRIKFLRDIMTYFEKAAARNALAVITVCETLKNLATNYGAKRVALLQDVSLLETAFQSKNGSLRKDFSIQGTMVLYVGNLERYQGIDLLLESFQKTAQEAPGSTLVIIGGTPEQIRFYQEKTKEFGIAANVRFAGPRATEHLGFYLDEADILVSPRILGGNTPMKIYSYLHSGKPILATDLLTHRQVLNEETAFLTAPTVETFSKGLVRLMKDPALRQRLGAAGRKVAEEKYTYSVFRKKVFEVYQHVEEDLK